MNQNLIVEIIDAIKAGRLEPKDQGDYPGAHSEPFFYKAKSGEDYVLLRAKDKSYAEGYLKQQKLYPFLLSQKLPVKTAKEMEIIEHGDDIYAVMERFFGEGHSPQRFAKATKEQQSRFVKQVAEFFLSLHTIPISVLPSDIDFSPYFWFEQSDTDTENVFLHADFNYSNFLTDDDYNLHSVFDWHPACIGPRVAEFATFVYCNDLPFLPLVLEKYNDLANTNITVEQVIKHNEERHSPKQSI